MLLGCMVFTTGYTHSIYLWTTGDLSLRRVFKVQSCYVVIISDSISTGFTETKLSSLVAKFGTEHSL